MRIKKRELAAMLILSELGRANIGEAITTLRAELCVTKRTAINIIKRLRKLGLVNVVARSNDIVVEPVEFCEAMRRIALTYINSRRARMRCGDEEGRTH